MERNAGQDIDEWPVVLSYGEVQMVPPFMIDGVNSAEVFLSNMNYAQVGGAVVVQEFIDGIQNDYLAKVKSDYPERVLCVRHVRLLQARIL